jgi:hypothetical protein
LLPHRPIEHRQLNLLLQDTLQFNARRRITPAREPVDLAELLRAGLRR